MIEGISAVTLGTHEMPRAVRFYRALGFEVLYSGEESSFTSFRAGVSYLNLIAQPAEQHWSWWGRVVELGSSGSRGSCSLKLLISFLPLAPQSLIVNHPGNNLQQPAGDIIAR
jgi:hypothetical protein